MTGAAQARDERPLRQRALRSFLDEHCRNAPVQPVLLNLPVSTFTASPASWGDVARLCRRICVLRERGRNEEAEQLRGTDLTRLLSELQSQGESEEAVSARVEEIFATEQERVANATVLAEILLPLLSEQLGAAQPHSSKAPAPFVAEVPTQTAAAPRPAPAGIADFIDAMIAQERDPPRRRAS